MKIFLDDVRPLPFVLQQEGGWTIIRTGEKFIEVASEIGLENISEMSLDHDLGEGIDGLKVVDWIEEQVKLHGKPLPRWNVHSMNPVEAIRMRKVLRALDGSDQ